MQRSAAKLLPPGEQVRVVIPTQSWHPVLRLAGLIHLLLLGQRYVLVVVTDRRIVVMKTQLLSYKSPVAIIGELPRGTRLGPATSWPASITVAGHRLYLIGPRQDVALADG